VAKYTPLLSTSRTPARNESRQPRMKNVTVLYFAAIRELAGSASESLTLPDHVHTVDDFVSYLGEHRAVLKGALSAVRVARNESFVTLADPIETGDVLALIPPVQGG
jgi:molybdopterin converting factor subunit 1